MKQVIWLITLCIGLLMVSCGSSSEDEHSEVLIAPVAAQSLSTSLEPEVQFAPTQSRPAQSPPTPRPVAKPDAQLSYCLWPGDTLSEIALETQVDESVLKALNPHYSGFAGSTLLLPTGSVPPERWKKPLATIRTIEELPFGVSGYYLSYDNRTKRVAFTFDIGYVPENHTLMKTLADRGIRATYFIIGEAAAKHPEIVAHVLENGHELANHSYTHANMLGMSESVVLAELHVTEEAVRLAYEGATTKPYFRAPFGAINDTIVHVARQDGYYVIGWTVDSSDWQDGATPELVYNRVTNNLCPGAIIVMHDVSAANGPAIPRILDFLDENGYEVVSLTELLFPH